MVAAAPAKTNFQQRICTLGGGFLRGRVLTPEPRGLPGRCADGVGAAASAASGGRSGAAPPGHKMHAVLAPHRWNLAFIRSQRRKMHNGVAAVHTARSRYANLSCVQVWGESESPDFLHFARDDSAALAYLTASCHFLRKNAEIYLALHVSELVN
jgi:hypothetical protein